MKTKRFCKSTVSMILALIMLVSMCTVAFLNTAAAEVDVADTGATITGGTTFYLSPNENWKKDGARFAAYFCNGSSSAHWYSAYGPNDDGYYWVTVNSGESHANIIWCRMNGGNTTNDWNNRWNQTNDLTWDGSKNLYTVSEGAWSNGGGTWSSYTPSGGTTDPSEDPDDPAEKVTISFLINSDTKWVASDDAKMFIKSGSTVTQMDETVDTKSGHAMWTAEVSARSSYTFYRTSYYFDESNASSGYWNSWTASSRGSNTVYKATDSGIGSWAASSTVNAADPDDIENFWDDLWIDTTGDGNTKLAIKVYYTGSTFHLYVPSYVNLSDVTVYSDHEKVVIGGTEYASGSKANLSTGTKTFAFKDGSTTTNKGNITIYQTKSTAALMMTTKEELFTGTTAGLMNSNAWPSGSGITSTNYNGVYKDAIETKGSIFMYSEDGELITDTAEKQVLKKIKGRGNSSFEASMRIYGKYAYNFNLDKKVALIDGAEKSKKWCLLANNVDHSMMRNTFVYQLADDLGLSYSPETRLVDAYDNGKYLGAFVITEKVEYGGSTLMDDMENLDDGNVLANSVFVPGTDPDDEQFLYEFDTDDLDDGIVKNDFKVNGQTYKYKYYATYDRPEVTNEETGEVLVEAASNLPFNSPENFDTEYNYLLEHELFNRYEAEASWFVTPKGQAVVVKYPEFATQAEMEWIITQYATMEQAVYNNDYATYSQLIDVDSFAKMYLIQELSINLDSCATSYYIHNEFRDGKSILVAGPVWDYDWAFGAYAGGTKFIYNGSSVTDSANMSNYEQMFVKQKALKTDTGDNTKSANYNLQAKLAQNSLFWTECQRIWTNQMAELLFNYIKDDANDQGIIIDEWLPKFQSSVDMNDARWGSYTFTGDNWGTKVTSDYTPYSYSFSRGNTGTSGRASKCYANTVYYLNDWLKMRRNYMSDKNGGNLYNAELLKKYAVSDASFTAVLSDAEVTITPSATVTLNDTALSGEEVSYTVYVDGEAVGTYDFTTNATVTLAEGVKSEIYIVVFPTADTSVTDTSDVQEFEYIPDVEFTVMFKATDAYRYVPTVTVNGTEYVMTQSGDIIGTNETGTQSYYWYEATVSVKKGESATLLFTNALAMSAGAEISAVEAGKAYYFGVDNLNDGTVAVELTDAKEYVRNFTKSEANMITNDPEVSGVATTVINGAIYKMGDVDEDGEVSILDATTIQLALVGKTVLSDTATDLSDFNLDLVTSIMDATDIQIYLASGV